MARKTAPKPETKSARIRKSASFQGWAKQWKLDESEQEVLAAFEAGELKPTKVSRKAKQEIEQAARNYFAKNARLNIRINNHDLLELKKRAAIEGLPYQTLAASIIHKFVQGTLG